MRKRITFLLALVMVLSLAACGNAAEDAADTKSTPAEQTAFDASWASNDFEKLIPQPPFEGWTAEQTSDNTYEMETPNADAAGDGSYLDTWAEYQQTLADCGFQLDGDVYISEGGDSNGTTLELQCGEGYAWITIIKSN